MTARKLPSLRIAVLVETPAWTRRLPDAAAQVRKFARAGVKAALADGAPHPKGAGPWTLTLLLADDAQLKALNHDFRGKAKPTNVLSFPAWEDAPQRGAAPVNLGDIAIALTVTAGESRKQGKRLADHLAHLTVHGVLHLFGYDHLDDSQADDMESLERAVLARHGIADPYLLRPARKAASRARKTPVAKPGGRVRKAARTRT